VVDLLSLFALLWIHIRSLLPVWCFSLIWTDGQMTSSNDSFSCASFISFSLFGLSFTN
jgi:hypothetical protein